MAVSAAFTFFTGILAFALRSLLVWENGKLDKKHGPKKERSDQPEASGEASSNWGDENYGPRFRYVL